MVFNDSVYRFLKWMCLIALPASSVFYSALDNVFGWGCVDTVCTVVAALETFIGTLIKVSTAGYNGGADDGKSK